MNVDRRVVTFHRELAMAIGKVKWFSEVKGFGFIAPNDGSVDLFAHVSAIRGSGVRMLKPGQTVTYNVAMGPKGRQAMNIRVQESPPAGPAPQDHH
jgi:cold shock protein